jgi:glycosyltransferase involved in cell wall biosynthesis
MNAPSGLRTVFATISRLGVAGIGGPAIRLAERLVEKHGPARVLAGQPGDGGLPEGSVQVVPRARWRNALEGTRLHRLQARSQAEERADFDRRAAAALPRCDTLIVENSTGLDTLRRAHSDFGSRVVVVQHNHPFREFRATLLEERERWGGPEPFITEALVERAEAEANEADLVVCLSDSTVAAFAAAGVNAERLRKARLCVDSERFRPPPSPPQGFLVAFVGWLSLRKGYPYLVQGFREAALPGARLVLHGGTNEPFDHALVARLRCDANVEVIRGPVEPTYAGASVCVLPSVSEGFGLSALEAMACGVPVIVTDACGVAECVEDGVDGFIVPARDPGAIADRLARLHAAPDLRASMGGAARRKALARPWSVYQDDWSRLLAV